MEDGIGAQERIIWGDGRRKMFDKIFYQATIIVLQRIYLF